MIVLLKEKKKKESREKIHQSDRLVDVTWFGPLFEKDMKSFALRPFPLKSQEKAKDSFHDIVSNQV